jgi:hypothetical protein
MTGFGVALLVGAALYFPLLYALRVTIDAFKTSPMVRIVSVRKRGAAFWTIAAAVVYIQVMGYVLLGKLPAELSAALAPWFWILFGIGPFVWWFVSRQAHARFDDKTFVPASTLGWAIKRAVKQYLETLPDEHAMVVSTGGDRDRELFVTWTAPHPEEQRARFTFDTKGQAARLWARIYALSPDVSQFDTMTFSRATSSAPARARLSPTQ